MNKQNKVTRDDRINILFEGMLQAICAECKLKEPNAMLCIIGTYAKALADLDRDQAAQKMYELGDILSGKAEKNNNLSVLH